MSSKDYQNNVNVNVLAKYLQAYRNAVIDRISYPLNYYIYDHNQNQEMFEFKAIIRWIGCKWAGYVIIPKDHSYFGLDCDKVYDKIGSSLVHGGIVLGCSESKFIDIVKKYHDEYEDHEFPDDFKDYIDNTDNSGWVFGMVMTEIYDLPYCEPNISKYYDIANHNALYMMETLNNHTLIYRDYKYVEKEINVLISHLEDV